MFRSSRLAHSRPNHRIISSTSSLIKTGFPPRFTYTAAECARGISFPNPRAGFPEARPPERLRVLDESGALVALAVPQGFGAGTAELAVEPVLHPDVVLLRG